MAINFAPFLDGHYDASINLQMHIYRRTEAAAARGERLKDELATPEQVAVWQRYARESALAEIGGLPEGGTPLEPEIVGSVQADGYHVENVIFQSLPGAYVTANLYVPDGLTRPTGAVLFLCGHYSFPKSEPEYQTVCRWLAKNGLVALVIDPIGQGERRGYLDEEGNQIIQGGTPEHTVSSVQCWWIRHSVVRYFVHDARRAFDYLCSRPEVDPTKLGATGNSGGGVQTAWLMMLEPRLAAAAPATWITRRVDYMWTGQVQDAEQLMIGGSAAGLDHDDFLIAMAPKPALVLAADYDFFNLEGTVETVERARRIYRILGKEENLGLVRARGVHQYHDPAHTRPATEFFARHLLGKPPEEVVDVEPRPVDPRLLTCTKSGQLLLDRPGFRRVFDLNLDEYERVRAARPELAERAARAREWLAEVVHRDRKPGELYPRWIPRPPQYGIRVDHGYWWSEKGVLSAGVLLRPDASPNDWSSLILNVLDEGTSDLEIWRPQLFDRVNRGQAVLVLDVRGTGCLAPRDVQTMPAGNPATTMYKLVSDLLCLGDSLEAGRVFDLLRAVDLAAVDAEIALGDRPISLLGVGKGAFHGYLAAALEPRLVELDLRDLAPDPDAALAERYYPFESTMECLLPDMPRHFGLSDLAPSFEGRRVVRQPTNPARRNGP